MLIEKVFRRHSHDTHRIIAEQGIEGDVTLKIMEGDVETTTMKLPDGRDLNAFAEGMLEGMHYQGSEVRKVKLKDAKR